MKRLKFFRLQSGLPERRQKKRIVGTAAMLMAGVWILLSQHQRLSAQCASETFVPPTISDIIWSFTQEPGGKFMVAGSMSGSGVTDIARLNSDGSIDNTFTSPTLSYPAGQSNRLRTVVRQADGKYMVGGFFTAPYYHIVRLNSNGTIDNSFVPPTFSQLGGDDSYVTKILPLPDGKYLVAGSFSSPRSGIVRLNADGSLDTTFGFIGVPGPDGPLQPLGGVFDFELESTGKILVGTQFGIQRLNADGTKDRSTFTNSLYAPNNLIQGVEVLADGKILACGSFSTPTNRVVRLNSDGTVDHTFTPPATLSSIVFEMEVQSDGKIMIGGTFGGLIKRLNADGSEDNTLNIPGVSGINFPGIRDIQLLPSGHYMAAGDFNNPKDCIAILCFSDIAISGLTGAYCAGDMTTVSYSSDATHTFGNVFTVQLSNASGNFNSPTTIGTLTSTASTGNISVTIPSNIAYGTGYRMRIVSSAPAVTGNNNGSNITLGTVAPTLSAGSPTASCDGTVTISSTIGSAPSSFPGGPTPPSANNSVTYAWSTGATTSSITVSSNGTYSLTVTDANGCTASASVTVNSIVPCCTAPSSAGVIAGAQTICPNTAAATLTSTSAASGGVGTLEYRWQRSTTGASSGFSNIANSNSATYAPGVLSTTTWFRRLGGVSCLTDWNLAPASNVIQVTVQDLVQPAIGCPSNQSVILNASCSASLPNYIGSALTTDNCAVLNVTQSPAAGTIVAGAGSMQVTLTVNDVNGNSNSCQFSVTKVDNTPPAISCLPHSIVFNGQADINLNVNDMASASDNCGLQSVVTSIPAISCAQLGQAVPVTVTATDNSGNTASCISMVTVQGLPCGWRQLPGGVNCANGNQVTYNTANQVFTVNSTNCHTPMAPHVADGFAFAQRTLCGNGSLQALVTDVNGLGWAGISMRESNVAGAKKVHLLTNRQFYHRREVRNANNAQVIPQTWLGYDRYWLRLVRTGTDIVGFISPNGNQWVQVLVAKVNMNSCIEIGLLTHHNNTTGNMIATFSNVAVTGNTTYYLQEQNNPGTTTPDAAQVDINQGAVFPNPSTGEIFVNLTSFAVEEMQLEVYDQLGRQLQSLQLSPMDMPWQRVDLSNLPAGVYFVKLSAAGYPQQTARVVIQRP